MYLDKSRAFVMLRQEEQLLRSLVAVQAALLDHACGDGDADEAAQWQALRTRLDECVRQIPVVLVRTYRHTRIGTNA